MMGRVPNLRLQKGSVAIATWRIVLATCFLAVNCAQAITEGDSVEICSTWDAVEPAMAVLIMHEPEADQAYLKDMNQRYEMDCIQVTNRGGMFISRFYPPMRRMVRLQELSPDGQLDTPWWPRHWRNNERNIGKLPAAIGATGIAVAEGGAVVHVASAAPLRVLIFDRDKGTGFLTFRAVREFALQSDRDELLRRERREWMEGGYGAPRGPER